MIGGGILVGSLRVSVVSVIVSCIWMHVWEVRELSRANLDEGSWEFGISQWHIAQNPSRTKHPKIIKKCKNYEAGHLQAIFVISLYFVVFRGPNPERGNFVILRTLSAFPSLRGFCVLCSTPRGWVGAKSLCEFSVP